MGARRGRGHRGRGREHALLLLLQRVRVRRLHALSRAQPLHLGVRCSHRGRKREQTSPGWIQRFTGGASTGNFFKFLLATYVTAVVAFILVSLAFGPKLLKTSYIVLYMAPVVTGAIDFFVMKTQEPMMRAMTYKNSEVGKVAEPGKLIFVLNGIYGPVSFARWGSWSRCATGFARQARRSPVSEFLGPVLATVMNLKASAAKQLADNLMSQIPTGAGGVQQCNGYLDCQMGATLLMTFIPGPLNPIAIVVFALIRCWQRRLGLLVLLNPEPGGGGTVLLRERQRAPRRRGP